MAYIFKRSSDKDNLFLFLWFVCVLVFTVVVQFIAARFVLLLYPAMFLLISKELELNAALGKKLLFFPVFIAAVISLFLAIGDCQLAGAYRDFASTLRQKLPPGAEIYFCPASFDTNLCYGYAYYLQKYYPQANGQDLQARLDNTGELIYIKPAGDFLSPVFYEKCPDYPRGGVYSKKLIGSFFYDGHVFLHNRKLRVGFYSHDWGLLPFYISFKKLPLEEFQVWKITKSRQG